MDERVLFVAKLISGNPGYTYWLDEVAEKVELTPCHLAHLFKPKPELPSGNTRLA